MKQLFIIALCLFSLFTFQSMHAYAVDCASGSNDAKAIDPKTFKNCEGVSDGSEKIIFYKLSRITLNFFLISCVLFVVGIVLSKRKKEPTKKERILIETLCWLPFVLIFFFIIINIFQILM